MPEHVSVEQDLPQDMPRIEADAEQMHLVVVSLVTNAVEAIGDHPGTIAVRARAGRFTGADFDDAARMWQTPDGDYLCLEVTDSGCGMGGETRRRMLEPFFTTKVARRGLGLAAVHGIVRAHRGALAVTSEIGRGTSVRVFLPVLSSLSSLLPRGDEEPGADIAAGEPRRGTILVVDDEPLVREVAEVILQSEGFGVVTARDGREARHAIDTRDDIAAVILDFSLPDVGGEELLGSIQRRRPGLPVILSSGHHEEIVMQGLHGDRLTFLQKPWPLSQLLAAVEQALSSKKSV